MTALNTRHKGDMRTTRDICRITLDGNDLPLCDVYYVDTRRGVVRGYERVENKEGKRVLSLEFGPRGLQIKRFEKRGTVRFWLKGALSWGASKAKRGAK